MDNDETFVGLDYDLNEIRIGAKVAVLEQLTIGTVVGPGEGDSVIVEWGSGQRADIIKDTLAVIVPLASDHPAPNEAESEAEMTNLRISLNADANVKNSIQFEYNGEIAFDLVIENDPDDDPDISAKATIRTWPIEGGDGEEASVLLRHRGPEPTGS